jgi:hypothetical protein
MDGHLSCAIESPVRLTLGENMKSATPAILLFGLLCFFVIVNWINKPRNKK